MSSSLVGSLRWLYGGRQSAPSSARSSIDGGGFTASDPTNHSSPSSSPSSSPTSDTNLSSLARSESNASSAGWTADGPPLRTAGRSGRSIDASWKALDASLDASIKECVADLDARLGRLSSLDKAFGRAVDDATVQAFQAHQKKRWC